MTRSVRYSNLVEALFAAPADKPFVTHWKDEDQIESVTFGDFRKLAKARAAELLASGVGRGDRVVLILPQGIDLMAAFAGAMFLGAIPAILAYPNFKVDRNKYLAGLAGVSNNLKARVAAVDSEFPQELIEHMTRENDTAVIRMSQNSDEPALDPVDSASSDLAFIQHSAGTTGLQKGVALSHESVLIQLQHLADVLKLNEADSIYSWLPLYHDMGLIACFMLPLVFHLPVVMQSPIDWVVRPATMLRLISQYRCTVAWVPNFALQFLVKRVRTEDREELDLSSLKALINCSEPVRAESMDAFQTAYEAYGLKPTALSSSYAMAENVFAVTQCPIGEAPRRVWIDRQRFCTDNVALQVPAREEGSLCFVSSGRCVPGNHVRIVSSDGETLPDGTAGEILIHSDSLFRGYFNRADLSATALRDGWYASGDLGFQFDGELYVTGRKKDLIIVAGKNIYPQDIEQIVCDHPAVYAGRVVAFGVYNPSIGTEEIVVVAEVQDESDLQRTMEIERAVRSAIAAEMDVVPRAICLKPPRWIIKSTAGKPARSSTREKLLKEEPEFLQQGA